MYRLSPTPERSEIGSGDDEYDGDDEHDGRK